LQSIFQCTRGIAFLGTPHRGASLAPWAQRLSRLFGVVKQTNTHIVALLRSDSEMLARIQDSFHAIVIARNSRQDNSLHVQHPIDICCFYEELPIPAIGQIVPRESAILPGYTSIGIHANHMDMARFNSADDPGFLAVCGELRRWVEAVSLLKPSGSGAAPCKIKWACPSHLIFQSLSVSLTYIPSISQFSYHIQGTLCLPAAQRF